MRDICRSNHYKQALLRSLDCSCEEPVRFPASWWWCFSHETQGLVRLVVTLLNVASGAQKPSSNRSCVGRYSILCCRQGNGSCTWGVPGTVFGFRRKHDTWHPRPRDWQWRTACQIHVRKWRQKLRQQKLLYLTGDKNRDTIPKILSSNKDQSPPIILHPLQVYETRGATDFEKNIGLLVAQEAQLRQGTSICTRK